MTDKKFLSTKEVAEILALSTRRVVGLCNAGKLPGAFQDGRLWKIPKESVINYQNKESTQKTEQQRLSCAVGSTSYIDTVKNSYYVDKTLLVRDLIEDHAAVTLFTRPRRFGKTLAMDMLKVFFEKTDKDNSVYFQDKQIWKCGEKYTSMQGKYPVIYITFKDVKFNNWEDTLEAIGIVMRDEYMRHTELFSWDGLDAVEREYLNKIQKGTLSNVEYTRALLNLSRMLEKYYHCKVIILIDEYDTPIQQGHTKGFYDDVITFMRNFMSGGLKDNASLEFGILTGILRVSKENLFSGLNNLVINSVIDEKYSEYFGFTTDEVSSMANYYGRYEKLEELKEWYDGYLFGNTEIYNPWSVANYFNNNCKPKPFWTNTSDNEIIREIMRSLTPEIADDLISIMQGKSVQTSLNMDVIYPKITDGTDSIFSFLLVAGYLKPLRVAEETELGTFVELALPNKEVRRVYNTEILCWLRSTLDGSIITSLEKALYQSDEKELKRALRNYMLTCISCFDVAAEGFYHGMMLGLSAGMSSKYYIRSNRESGDGRFDLILEPKISSMPGIIMEFKSVKEENKLLNSAKEALQQINDKEYDIDFKDRGINNISKYGIAFCGKKVEIVM